MGLIGTDERVPSNLPQILYARATNSQFTGILISKDLVLTVSHGVYSFEPSARSGREPYYGTATFQSGDLNPVEGSVVYLDKQKDIALFQLKEPIEVEPLKLNVASQTTLFQDTSLVSYPADYLGEQQLATADFLNVVDDELQYTFDTYAGSSGGAIIDMNGEVVGVHQKWIPSWDLNAGERVDNDLIDLANYYDSLEGPINLHDINLEGLSENLHRFLNTENYTHLYTADLNVIEDLYKNDSFIEESINVEITMEHYTNYVYEFYNHATKSFFYTKDYRERLWIEDNLEHFQYNDKTFGVADNVMHRMYNPNTGTHFFTDSEIEADHIVANLGYVSEGFL